MATKRNPKATGEIRKAPSKFQQTLGKLRFTGEQALAGLKSALGSSPAIGSDEYTASQTPTAQTAKLAGILGTMAGPIKAVKAAGSVGKAAKSAETGKSALNWLRGGKVGKALKVGGLLGTGAAIGGALGDPADEIRAEDAARAATSEGANPASQTAGPTEVDPRFAEGLGEIDLGLPMSPEVTYNLGDLSREQPQPGLSKEEKLGQILQLLQTQRQVPETGVDPQTLQTLQQAIQPREVQPQNIGWKDRIVDALRGVASVRGYEGVDFRDMRRQRELGDEEVRLAQDKMGDRESLGANFAAKEVLSENQHGRNLELENFRQGGVDPVSQYIAELMGKDFLGEQDFQRDAALAGLKNSAQLSPEALFAAIAERYPE